MSEPYAGGFQNTGNPVIEHPEGTPSPDDGADLTDLERRKSLLDLSPKRAASRMVQEFEGSTKPLKNLMAQWKVNRLRSLGHTGVELLKVQDEQRAYVPYGSAPNPRLFNKARTLCRRVRSMIFADPPVPEATPTTDEDQAVDAAEFASRALNWVSDQIDYDVVAGDAFDVASDYASGFIWFWVDDTAGGWRPREIEAAPGALSVDNPLVDPATGRPADPNSLVKKYVKTDKTLTADKHDPAVEKMWMPGLRRQIVTGKQGRFLPQTCRDVWDADGFQIGAMLPLGMLRGMFGEDRNDVDGTTVLPGLNSMNDAELTALASYSPKDAKDLIPPGYKLARGSEVTDETLVFCLTRYHVSSSTYPTGFYGVVLGDKHLAYRGPWYDDTNVEPLDIPVTQFEQVHDEDQPYGHGLMEYLGPGNEVMGAMIDSMLTHIERLANRRIFLPLQSPIQEEQLQSPMGTVLRVPPGMGPTYEEVPQFPQPVLEMLDMMKKALDDESGLQQQAQAVNMPSVTSGAQANAIVEQVRVMMSDLIQHTERALVRGYRIIQQQVRWKYTIPQRLSFAGDDGAYREHEWTGSDLGTTRDVQLRRGSFTQLAVTAKAALVAQYQTAGYLSVEEAEHAVTGQVGGLLGLQDNPHRLRVRAQTSQWRDGPPDGWQPIPPQPDPQTGQPGSAADPANPFADRRAVDLEPVVAKLRAYEIGRILASRRVQKKPPAWRAFLEAEYDAMRQAAGIATVAEQQASQKAQADAAASKEAAEQKLAADKLAVEKMKVDVDAQRLQFEAAPKPVEPPKISISATVADPNQVTELLALHGIELSAPNIPEPREAVEGEGGNGKRAAAPGVTLRIIDATTRPRKYKLTRDAEGRADGAEAVEELAEPPIEEATELPTEEVGEETGEAPGDEAVEGPEPPETPGGTPGMGM